MTTLLERAVSILEDRKYRYLNKNVYQEAWPDAATIRGQVIDDINSMTPYELLELVSEADTFDMSEFT